MGTLNADAILKEKFEAIKTSILDPKGTGMHVIDNKIIFQQIPALGQTPPWSKMIYGPKNPAGEQVAGYTDIADSGCGLCSLAAPLRMLTKNNSINPGMLARKYGKYHVKNVGSKFTLMTEVPIDFGCMGQEIPLKKAIFTRCLDEGKYIVIVGKTIPPFYGEGHFVYIRSYDDMTDAFSIGNSYPIGAGVYDFIKPYTWEMLTSKPGLVAAWAIYNINPKNLSATRPLKTNDLGYSFTGKVKPGWHPY